MAAMKTQPDAPPGAPSEDPPVSTTSDWTLERQALDTLGYSAPLPLADPRRVDVLLECFGQQGGYVKNPHASSQEARHLLNDPGLIAAVNGLCGPDLVLWRSAIFVKTEGSAEIGWHHDKHFHAAAAEDIMLHDIRSHFSVLFGLTDIVQTTGMMEMIPGSHLEVEGFQRDLRPFHKRPPEAHILKALPGEILARARPLPIPAGSFVVFHSAILHRSLSHVGRVPRLGIAIRLVKRGLEIPRELAAREDILDFPPPGG